MTRIVRENKLIYCMGDFNVNLLNYNVHNPTNDILDSMLSNYLLSYIFHPTCVTDHSVTVIDNIFSNNTVFESVSGNIRLTFQITSHNLLSRIKLISIIKIVHM